MSKKVKCCECEYGSSWAYPTQVTKENLEYAKSCLNTIKRSLFCLEIMKTKSINNEQYCKHFKRGGEFRRWTDKEFEEYEKQIASVEDVIGEEDENGQDG